MVGPQSPFLSDQEKAKATEICHFLGGSWNADPVQARIEKNRGTVERILKKVMQCGYGGLEIVVQSGDIVRVESRESWLANPPSKQK